MSDARRRQPPQRVEIYDTTLRDGSQLEGISLTVEDKLRIAEQLDWLGVALHRGGLARREPEGRRAVPARAGGAAARRRRTLVAFGSTRRVKGKVDSDDTLRHLVEANVGTVCIVGKSWDYHVLEALGTTLDEGVAMVARLGRVPARRGHARCCSTPSTSSTATSATPSSRCACSKAAATKGASPARAVRHQRRRAAARGRADRRARSSTTSAATSASRCTCTTTRGTGVANALAGVLGGATQVQGTINGYGERTGNCNLTTIIPNLTLKMGIETIPADRLERLTPVAHHVAELVNMPLNPQARVRRALRVRAQGRAAHERDREAARRVRARLARRRSATARASSCRSSPASRRSVLKAKELGLELDGPQLAEVVETLKRLEHEGYHFEVADGSLELLMRRATGWRARLVRRRVVPGDHRRPQRRRHAHRRDAARP